MNFQIKYDDSKKCEDFILNGLISYNNKNCHFFAEYTTRKEQKFGFCVYDGNKRIGGIYGYINTSTWLYIDLLFVDENYRGQDIGTELMNIAEKHARKNKCYGIRTETWSFQALGFYEKMGYELYGQLDNHPPGAIEYFLKKILEY